MSRAENRALQKERQIKGLKKLGLAIVLVVAVIYLLSCISVRKDLILSTSYVNDTDVSGMTKEEASAQIEADFKAEFKDRSLKVKAGTKEYQVPYADILALDANKAAETAYAYGHGNFFERGACILRSVLFSKKHVIMPEIISENGLEEQLKKSGVYDAVTTVQTSYELQDDTLIFKKGVTGGAVSSEELKVAVMEAVEKADYDTVLEAPMTEVAVEPTNMEELYTKLHKVCANATLDPKNDYKVVKAVTGLDFDPKEAQAAFDSAEEGADVLVPVDIEKPKVTTKQLKKKLFKDNLGSCSLDVASTRARINNIKLALKKIDGTILLAGDEFSFNKVTGKRNADKGYEQTGASVDGAKDVETAGGVCQVAAALFYSAVHANLDITEHHVHTYSAIYLSPGQDAAVNDKADLKFTNTSLYPVKIKAEYDDNTGQLSVRLYGAKLDKNKVTLDSRITNSESYGQEVWKDNSLEQGNSYVYQDGRKGCTVENYRVITDKDGKEISSEKLDTCTYASKNQIVVKGTKVVAPPTTQAKDETAPADGDQKGTTDPKKDNKKDNKTDKKKQ